VFVARGSQAPTLSGSAIGPMVPVCVGGV